MADGVLVATLVGWGASAGVTAGGWTGVSIVAAIVVEYAIALMTVPGATLG
jgi:hypothetical protein